MNTISKTDSAVIRRNHKGETPLHVACIKGNLAKVKQIIAQGKQNLNLTDFAGKFCVGAAIGLDIFVTHFPNLFVPGWSPLSEACNFGHFAIANELLKSGADANAIGCDNNTPLHDAR